jgi:hypothetical protein
MLCASTLPSKVRSFPRRDSFRSDGADWDPCYQVPYFNAPIYLPTKAAIGKVDEILGPISVSLTRCSVPDEGKLTVSIPLSPPPFYAVAHSALAFSRYFANPRPPYSFAPPLLPLRSELPTNNRRGLLHHQAVGGHRRDFVLDRRQGLHLDRQAPPDRAVPPPTESPRRRQAQEARRRCRRSWWWVPWWTPRRRRKGRVLVSRWRCAPRPGWIRRRTVPRRVQSRRRWRWTRCSSRPWPRRVLRVVPAISRAREARGSARSTSTRSYSHLRVGSPLHDCPCRLGGRANGRTGECRLDCVATSCTLVFVSFRGPAPPGPLSFLHAHSHCRACWNDCVFESMLDTYVTPIELSDAKLRISRRRVGPARDLVHSTLSLYTHTNTRRLYELAHGALVVSKTHQL